MEKFVMLTKLIMGKGVEIIDVVKVFLYLQPSILLISIPMAILIAIFLTYGRMATDNEIVVLKGSGMSFWGISKAAIILSLSGFFIHLFISLYLSPISTYSFKQTLYKTITKKASMILEEETFSNAFKDTVIYVKDIPSKNRFKGIFVFKDAETIVKKPSVIVAEEGSITVNPEEGLVKLRIHNGIIHTFNGKSSSKIVFSEYDLVLTTEIKTIMQIEPNEIGIFDLWKGRKGSVLWNIELNRRFAFPFACLIFGILGPALSNKMGKIGRLGGFSFSLSILILYYLLLIIGEGLAKAYKLPAFEGVWGPNIFFGTIAILFFYKAYKDKPIKRIKG
jgi:lipopolysaccharide export system permease protein